MHNIKFFDYSEKDKKDSIVHDLNAYVESYGGGGLPTAIRWHDNVVCESYDMATEYLIDRDRGGMNYDQLAVRYKSYGKTKPSKALDEATERVTKQRQRLDEIIKESGVQNRTSEFIGCPKCGSSLKRTLLRGQDCPLCCADLRSKTNLDRISSAKEKLETLQKKREEIRRKQSTAEIRWLVKIEYHT